MRTEKRLSTILFILWGLLFFISVAHLFSAFFSVKLSNITIGSLGWTAFAATIIYLGRKSLFTIFSLFLVFFTIGYFTGSFLEPPADPLDHLRESYLRCDSGIDMVDPVNNGLWQYGMNAVILCPAQQETAPDAYLLRADVLNGIYYGMGAAVLFLVAQSAGFPDRWAVMSVAIAFLFFGTNVFSYFRYYSYAPSFSSILLYWLWIASFFFKKGRTIIITGLAFALMAIAIVVVNHIQEAIFLFIIVILWLIVQLIEKICINKNVNSISYSASIPYQEKKKILYFRCAMIFCCGFIILFILPQWGIFREFLSSFFLYNYWNQNQDVVFRIHGWIGGGRIWEWKYRIIDTLGFVGFLPILLIPIFFISFRDCSLSQKKIGILLLGLVPFLIYCTPLLNYIWLSNCVRKPTHVRYYYRMCYSSLSWLTVTYAFVVLEHLFLRHKNLFDIYTFRQKEYIKKCIFSSLLIVVLLIASISSFPVYGKLEFFEVASKPWWPKWREMINEILSDSKGEIITDPITGMVVSGVFARKIAIPTKNIQGRVLLIEEMDALSNTHKKMFVPAPICLLIDDMPLQFKDKFSNTFSEIILSKDYEKSSNFSMLKENEKTCIVNLLGFTYSWVPVVTRHWNPGYSKTRWFYRYRNAHVADLEKELQDFPPRNCKIFFNYP